MSRCCMCNYCPTTKDNDDYRSMHYDYNSEEHYCSVCVEQWSIALSEYEELNTPKEANDE